MQGILLIGMPGVGKSSLGKKVAELLGFTFFDGDEEIMKAYPDIPDIQEYLDVHGDEEYIKMEGDVVSGLPREDTVLSPGGSIIYSRKCRECLGCCFKVFLDASLQTIKKRLTNVDRRGIVYLKKLGLDALYEQREKLYRPYADVIFDTEKGSEDGIAKAIVAAYSVQRLAGEKVHVEYRSTNGKSEAPFTQAMMQGLAPDKGLFVPEKIPAFSAEELGLMKNMDYPQLAYVIMRRFADIDDDSLRSMCEQAYSSGLEGGFTNRLQTDIIPIESHGDVSIARLDQGPTCSFKDFGAQLLSRMMEHAARSRKLVILTATSGDTGGAVAAAFHGRNARAVILMPAQEITARQRRQMTTLGGNVTAVLVRGKFDDCQALAKKAFAEIPGLTSANSINIGRLLPQTVYYFYIWSRTNADTIIVPSGNFGNVVAGLLAKRMGLPARFAAAVNENDEVPRFLETGRYEPIAPSKRCISNAMNVGNPSNLARLVWLYGGRMAETGRLEKAPDMERMRGDMDCVSVTDEETREGIKEAYKKGIVLEPHGAVGWAAVRKLSRSKNLGKVVMLETAHPAKFPEELDRLGVKYAIPESLKKIDSLKEDYVTIDPDLEELKGIISG